MTTDRLDMRIDAQDRRKLSEMAEDEGSISETARRLIDEAYEVLMHSRRMEAVELIVNANVGPPPELDELRRLVDEAASPGHLR
jgi:DNA transposition AAA+ family ATPase